MRLARADVVVDAVFGTGFHGVPQGQHALAIRAVNEASVPVVAVDIPSGVEGESGAVRGEARQGHRHRDLGRPEAGHRVPPGGRPTPGGSRWPTSGSRPTWSEAT